MKTLNLSLDLTNIKVDKPTDQYELWENFVIAGCRSTYRDGLDLKFQKRVFKILDAISKKVPTISLEDAEFEILLEIQERGKFDPTFCRIASQIDERLEEANLKQKSENA